MVMDTGATCCVISRRYLAAVMGELGVTPDGGGWIGEQGEALLRPLAKECWGFTQVWLPNEVGDGWSLYYFPRMPFGILNGSYEMSEAAEEAVCGAPFEGSRVLCCIDDILLLSVTLEEHLELIEWVLKRLEERRLLVHPKKSVFLTQQVDFLGYRLSLEGAGKISATEMAAKAFREMPVPSNVKELRSGIGGLSYFRRLCPRFSELAQPLHELLKKGASFQMTPEREGSWKVLVEEICRNAVRPFDPEVQCQVFTDWSVKGLGGCLVQRGSDGVNYLVAAISRSVTAAEAA